MSDRTPPVVWLHDVREDGVLRYRMGRQGRSLVAEWPRIGRLTCDADGTRPRLTPRPGTSKGSLAKLRGMVKVLVGDLRGGIGLHASAVALGTRAVLLLGDSGAGKSTAAAELCLRHGARLLADDAALLEERNGVVRVVPSEDRHYLTERSADTLGIRLPERRIYNGKGALRPAHAASRACRLALVILLRFDDSVAQPVSRRLTGIEAAMRLLPVMFRFDVDDRRQELDRLASMHQQAPFLELVRPHAEPCAVPAILRALGRDHG